jgi:hypothetical protein
MRVVAVTFLAFLPLALALARPHQFAPLPTKQMPAVNVPDKWAAKFPTGAPRSALSFSMIPPI